MRGKGIIVVAACAFATAVPGAAHAANTFKLDSVSTSSRMSVAVDSAGTGYFAWARSTGSRVIEFCSVPRGGTACQNRQTLSGASLNTATTIGGVRVLLLSSGAALVAVGDGQRLYYWISNAGSPIFPAPGTPTGDIDIRDGALDDFTLNENHLGFVGNRGLLDGFNHEEQGVNQDISATRLLNGRVATSAAGVVAAGWTIAGGGNPDRVHVIPGTNTGGPPHTGVSFGVPVIWEGSQPSVAGGPNSVGGGPYGAMVVSHEGAFGSRQLTARRQANGFGSPTVIASDVAGQIGPYNASYQTSGGEYLVVAHAPSGGIPVRLYRSGDGGATWSCSLVAAASATRGNGPLAVAAAPDGQGWALSHDGGVEVSDLSAISGCTAAAAGTAPAPAGAGAATGTRPVAVAATKALKSLKHKDRKYTLLGPPTCVPRGQQLPLKIKVDPIKKKASAAKKKKKSSSPPPQGVAFVFVGEKKKDKKSPFSTLFPTTKVPPTKYKVSAILQFRRLVGTTKQRRKPVEKTIRGDVVIC